MPKILTSADFKSMPWKNGGGVTTELFRLPHPQLPESFLFRISCAQVHQDGPFSLFEGIHRHLLLLEGQGFILQREINATTTLNQSFEPIAFEGEEKINCHLMNGSCLDFNVMTLREAGVSEVSVIVLVANESIKFTSLDHEMFFYDHTDNKLIHLQAHETFTYQVPTERRLIRIRLSLTSRTVKA